MNALLIVLLVVILVVALAGAPSVGLVPHNYGWGPSGVLIVVVVILLILVLLGKL